MPITARMKSVVPLAVECGFRDEESFHFCVGDLDTLLVRAGVKRGFFDKPGRGANAANRLDDRLVIDQRRFRASFSVM